MTEIDPKKNREEFIREWVKANGYDYAKYKHRIKEKGKDNIGMWNGIRYFLL